jgi:formylglycine-generating enzyme required for sulfatase activity
MRLISLFALCCFIDFSYSQKQFYQIPEAVAPKYYFKPGDSALPCSKPTTALLRVLKDWTYIAEDSIEVEEINGYDSIRPLYGDGYKARHSGFFFSPREVSNQAYKRFLYNQIQPGLYPDTNCWIQRSTYNQAFVKYYFQHPAYNQYPVCGISFSQAFKYCKWLEDSLNCVLKKKNIPQRVEVNLPSTDEWVNIYYHSINQQRKKEKQRITQPTYLYFSFPGHNKRVIYGDLYSYRLAYLKTAHFEWGSISVPVDGMQSIGGVYNIMGNMAEWTRTTAKGSIYNNKEYIYTVTGRLANNTYEQHSESTLNKYIRGEKLNDLMVVKGGSWADEHYYLQPAALYLFNKDQSSAKIGFRPVIRVLNL